MPGAPVWMEGLTPEYVQKAKQELGETKEVQKQALKELRKLINVEADFRPQTDDAFLIRFLRAKKYDVTRTFQTLCNFYTFQAKYSGLLTGCSPTELLHVIHMNNIFVLPYRHPSGAAIGVMRLGHFNIDLVSAEEIFATCMASGEVIIESEATQVCGYILIIDMSKFNMRMVHHYAKPSLLYKIVKVVQECIPYRMKAFHVIHEPFYCNIIYNMLKPLLSDKLAKRIHFHRNNLRSLHQHIPPEILPIEFGGEIFSISKPAKDFCAKLLSKEPLFEKIKHFGYQDKKVHFIKKQDSRTLFN